MPSSTCLLNASLAVVLSPAVWILSLAAQVDDGSEAGSLWLILMVFFSLAFETFLTSLVKHEMSQMPRGVYFSALRGGSLRSDQGKTVAGIPAFMLKTYEKNKQPGLKPGLAGD